MNRIEVYECIDSERAYQDKMAADINQPYIIPDMHVGDSLGAIQHNLNKALETWYINSTPHSECMVYLRKIAALCVAQMEQNGCIKREL